MKKLALRRETLQSLEADEAGQVKGAATLVTNNTCATRCGSFVASPTRNNRGGGKGYNTCGVGVSATAAAN